MQKTLEELALTTHQLMNEGRKVRVSDMPNHPNLQGQDASENLGTVHLNGLANYTAELPDGTEIKGLSSEVEAKNTLANAFKPKPPLDPYKD